MTYWALNLIFLGAVAGVAIAAVLGRRSPSWRAIACTGIVLVVVTAIFDNVMIAIGLVGYNRHLISGAFVGIAPIEDFAYAIAAIVLLPSLWSLFEAAPRSSS